MSGRVIVVDLTPFIRLAVRSALEEAGHQVVGEAGSLQCARELVATRCPDVVLVDADVDPELVLVGELRRTAPDAAVVVLASSASPAGALAAVRAGACGFVPKDTDPQRLPAIVSGVLRGEAAIPRPVMRHLLRELSDQRSPVAACTPGITVREQAVLDLLADGLADREAAARLGISEVTVRRHVAEARRRLRLDRRSEVLEAHRRRRVA